MHSKSSGPGRVAAVELIGPQERGDRPPDRGSAATESSTAALTIAGVACDEKYGNVVWNCQRSMGASPGAVTRFNCVQLQHVAAVRIEHAQRLLGQHAAAEVGHERVDLGPRQSPFGSSVCTGAYVPNSSQSSPLAC